MNTTSATPNSKKPMQRPNSGASLTLHLTPEAFAERLISRERLERSDANDPGCLSLRNISTGETLVVDSVQMERWMNSPV